VSPDKAISPRKIEPGRKIDLVILAGENTKGSLAPLAPGLKCLIKFAHMSMLERTAAALMDSKRFSKSMLVGPKELAPTARKLSMRFVLEKGDPVLDVLEAAGQAESEEILISNADLPLLEKEGVADFVDRSFSKGVSAFYPLVRDTTYNAVFAEAPRRWITLREGRFTGGNMMIAPREVLLKNSVFLRKGFARRKDPIFMGMLLGPVFVLKYATGRLSIADIETKLTHILKTPARVVESTFASMFFDVDRKSDYELAKRLVEGTR
jgi:hypothetical protein